MASESALSPATSILEPIAKQDLHSETIARLAQLVVSLEPGSRLPTEQELCRQLGIGRSTLREAVRALTFIGAVQPRRGSGTYVSTGEDGAFEKLIGLGFMVQRARVNEVVEMRRVLELESVRLAAVRHTAEERKQLESVMTAMGKAISNPSKAAKYDLEYNVLLGRASHNTVLMHLVSGMRVLLEIWMSRAVNQRATTAQIVKEHNSVLEAVFANKPELAAERMDAHLARAADRLLAVIGQDQLTSDFVSALFNPGQ